jgi:hypothetical protein
MTTDLTPPHAESGPTPAGSQGPSQGHRRRRRRRKNKSSQPGTLQAPQGHQAQSQPAPQPQAQGAPQRPAQQPHQNRGRKKKFFQKSSAPAAQPGNSVRAPSQGKRKNRQKGPREFVGPMDHSYRAVNGNVADGPPSTIQITSNGHGSHYQEAYVSPAPVAVREDAPTRIFCFIDDLFFIAKIQETARKLGVKVEFVKGDKEVVARIADAPETERPKLLVFDLNNVNAKPMTLIPKFKLKLKKSTSIIGFLSHLQGDLKMKAVEAGCDTVMPRSAFSQSLPSLLRRYGVEEEEDYAPQPV